MTKEKEIIHAGWNFENSYSRLPKSFFTNMKPTPVKSPKLIIFNQQLARSLGFDIEMLRNLGVSIFAGNDSPEGAYTLAQAYAGHQFGHFTMLGDGRAILLGEQMTSTGERYDIQLKGSGRTPYSRGGDGRAALGPMLREYIISEAMYALGIPTTRSLAVVTTGESVIRETTLSGAILTRVATSHLRVGTFQYAANWCTNEELQVLADYTINRHFPLIQSDKNRYLALLKEVIKRQAELIAKWQLVGFIHGVMNTDNMTISGETIDYGPCAFMDTYDLATVFSSIDTHGRYAYGNQPAIAAWNLARFAETLLPLLDDNQEEAIELAENALSEFSKLYDDHWLNGMRRKLGLFNEKEQDEALIKELLQLMGKYQADYTNTFRALTLNKTENTVLFNQPEFKRWYEQWRVRVETQTESKTAIQKFMKTSNPAIIPRNHRVEEALDAAATTGDITVMEKLLEVLSNPYAYSPEQEHYTNPAAATIKPYRTYCGT